MRNRDLGFIALGRFLAVERYRETCLSSSTQQLRALGLTQTGGRADTSDARSGSRAPARPQHG